MKIKKGDIVLVHFYDHSYDARGVLKDDKIMEMFVTGRLKSQRGKVLVIDMWWLQDKGLESNHEVAKVLKSAIIKIWKLKIC